MMPNDRKQFLVRFGYVGERFSGLQEQGSIETAGAAMRRRIESAFGVRARALTYTARTDAGVHATTNVATFWVRDVENTAPCMRALEEARLDGLVGLVVEAVDKSVHARTRDRKKRYRYVLQSGALPGQRDDAFAWQIVPPLHVERLRKAATHLLGTHDFTSFRAARCSAGTPVKTLTRVDIEGPYTEGLQQRFVIHIEGDAFVRKMIRIMVGTLAEIGVGLREPSDMPNILLAKDRQAAGVTAPARGLTLAAL